MKISSLGTCGLCLTENVPLCKSHLLPKAFYKHILKEYGELHYSVGPKTTIQTSKQISDYFLCTDCEDRFNKNGEKWVLENYNFKTGRFPLQEALQKVRPIEAMADIACYDGRSVPGIDIDKLCYFAISVFWRAAAKEWHIADYRKRLTFDKYEEALRLYLLGHPFPREASLHIFISSSSNSFGSYFFPHRLKSKGYYHYAFTIRGIIFNLCLGKGVKENSKQICAIHSKERNIFLSSAVDKMSLENARGMALRSAGRK